MQDWMYKYRVVGEGLNTQCIQVKCVCVVHPLYGAETLRSCSMHLNEQVGAAQPMAKLQHSSVIIKCDLNWSRNCKQNASTDWTAQPASSAYDQSPHLYLFICHSTK
eukprot:5290036-Pleurochrysis_carterae.AAC.1